MGKIKAIIFDWSGVISDEWTATFLTSNDVLEEYGHERISEEKFKELYELPFMNFYKKLNMKVNEQKEYKLWEKIFPKYKHLLKPFPKAKKALEWLKARNIKCVVLSSHCHKLLEEEIKDYGLGGIFDAFYGSIIDKRDKIDELIEEHEIERENSLYVGDMCHDIDTAKKAGIRSVAVMSGYDTREKLESLGPDFMIEGIGQLPSLIEKLDGEKECATTELKSQ